MSLFRLVWTLSWFAAVPRCFPLHLKYGMASLLVLSLEE